MTKIIKIKVGEVYISGVSYPVFKAGFERVSKSGTVYYEACETIFVNEVEDTAKKEVVKK